MIDDDMVDQLEPLKRYLDSLSGVVELEILGTLLRDLKITPLDIPEFCIFDRMTYRRNLVSRSDWYELLAICWRTGHSSPIHDHHGSSCAFKILSGVATERNFEASGPGRACETSRIQYSTGDVCLSSSSHIHQVKNNGTLDLVTLHIYSPPLKMGLYREDRSSEPVSLS
jgi:cysteine dioxygenase